MYNLPTLIAFSLAAIFAVAGLVQLAGPRFLRDAYRGWDYSQGLRLVTGLLDIAAALMLAEPSLRGWGLVLAAMLIFGSVVTMLNHRQYVGAACAILMMAALVPATLAVPLANPVQFTTAAPQRLAQTR
jgi:hypothetical protein